MTGYRVSVGDSDMNMIDADSTPQAITIAVDGRSVMPGGVSVPRNPLWRSPDSDAKRGQGLSHGFRYGTMNQNGLTTHSAAKRR